MVLDYSEAGSLTSEGLAIGLALLRFVVAVVVVELVAGDAITVEEEGELWTVVVVVVAEVVALLEELGLADSWWSWRWWWLWQERLEAAV